MSTKKIIDILKDNAPLIVSVAAAIGVGVTAVLSAKAGAKAERIKHRKITEKDKKMETVTCYIPAAVSGAITCFCIIEAHVLNAKQKAALVACYMTMKEAYQEYRRKNIELYGEENDTRIMQEIQKSKPPHIYDPTAIVDSDDLPSDGDILIWTEHCGYATVPVATLINASFHLNRNLTLEGFCPLRLYFEFLGLELSDQGSENYPINLGFSIDTLIEDWNNTWFDVWYHKHTTDDGLEYWTIDFACEPEYVEYSCIPTYWGC